MIVSNAKFRTKKECDAPGRLRIHQRTKTNLYG
jgi:hypothetical protein